MKAEAEKRLQEELANAAAEAQAKADEEAAKRIAEKVVVEDIAKEEAKQVEPVVLKQVVEAEEKKLPIGLIVGAAAAVGFGIFFLTRKGK